MSSRGRHRQSALGWRRRHPRAAVLTGASGRTALASVAVAGSVLVAAPALAASAGSAGSTADHPGPAKKVPVRSPSAKPKPAPAPACPPVDAHRGAGAGYPSGSRPAFVAAAQAGARTLELDVRFTANATPVVFHDPTIDDVTDGTGAVASFRNWTALSQWRIDGVPADRQQSIPTLAQVLGDGKADHVQAYLIELKTVPTQTELAAFLDKLDALGLDGRVTVASMLPAALAEVAAARPALPRASIYSGAVDPAVVRESGTGAEVEYKALNATYVRALRAAGITKVYAWTPDRKFLWQGLARYGIDGIITNMTVAYIAGCND